MSAAVGDLYTPAGDVDAPRALETWAWFLRRPYRLLGLSTFGDLFLEDADGSVKMLDLVACELKSIATCIEEFDWGLGDATHQEEWLMAGLCRRAMEAGIRRAAGQCLAFRTPPILGGSLEPENLIAWDRWAYYEGLAKLLPQVLDLPLGTEVVIKPSGNGG
jgi:Domain of unknown function (DUF1851)